MDYYMRKLEERTAKAACACGDTWFRYGVRPETDISFYDQPALG